MCLACNPIGLFSRKAVTASRRDFLKKAGVLALGVGSGSLGSPSFATMPTPRAPSEGPADTIYFGGPIITMNDLMPAAQALAVRGGRILAVGALDTVEVLAGPGTRRVDLSGKTLLPGFFDAHSHVTMVGLQAMFANLLPAPDGEGNSIAALQRILRAWAADNAKLVDQYALILGFGYDDSQLQEQRHPTRFDLDQVSTDLPILIIHQSGHVGVANSKALKIAGITTTTPNPEGGIIRREPGSDSPNGVLEEQAFFAALAVLLERLDQEANLAMLKAGATFYAKYGYTTCQDGRSSDAGVAIMQLAASRNELPIDVLAYPDILSASDSIKTPAWNREYRNRFRIGGAKLTIDGSPQAKTAWLSQPYYIPPEGQSAAYAGYPAIPNDVSLSAVDRAFANGWQIIVHANGDAAIDVLIAAVRESTRKHGPADRRPVLIHGQTAREDQVDSLKELDIIPSFFPMHTFYWGDWHRDSVLGPRRADTISPCGWALRRAMKFTSHHDAPVANPDSMRVLSATVTRRTRSGDILGPDQRVPVEAALKSMTLWSAYQHFEEDQKGSLEVGKLADLVILSDNPLSVDAETLASLKVIETIKEDVTVFRAQSV